MIGEPTLILVIIINTIVGLSDKLNVSGVNSVSLPTRKPISKKKKKELTVNGAAKGSAEETRGGGINQARARHEANIRRVVVKRAKDGRIRRIPSVSTLHPREPFDVLTNSAAPRADNYFCTVASPRVFIYPGSSLFPFLFFFHLPIVDFSRERFFVACEQPHAGVCASFAKAWGDEGYGAWCSLLRFKSPPRRTIRTVREPPSTGPSTPPFAVSSG